MKDDGVKRWSIDYLTGCAETFQVFGVRLEIEKIRCKPGEIAGLTVARQIADTALKIMTEQLRLAQIEAETKGGTSDPNP